MTICNCLFFVKFPIESLTASQKVLRQKNPLQLFQVLNVAYDLCEFLFFPVTSSVLSFALLQCIEPANRDRLSTITAFVCTKGWLLWTGFTVEMFKIGSFSLDCMSIFI